MEPKYITLDEAIAIHQRIMIKTEQSPQFLRDRGALDSALARPRYAAIYSEGEVDLIYQASLLCIQISQAQAFVDGNKRTAVAITDVFLRRSGFQLPKRALELSLKLEEVAKEFIANPGQQNRDLIEKEFANWFRIFVIPLEPRKSR